MTDRQDSAADTKAWVDANRDVVEQAYQVFLETGEWATVGPLQRHFDRLGRTDIDIRRVIDSKPLVTQEGRRHLQDYLPLHLRDLMWVPAAKSLVTTCISAVQRVVESYFSDDERPHVTADDDLVPFPSKFGVESRKRVYTVLTTEHPSPFAGSSVTEGSWSIDADTRFARQFKDVHSVDEFVARQDAIREEMAAQSNAFTETLPSVIENFNESFAAEMPNQSINTEEKPSKPILFLSWGRTRAKSVAKALVPIFENRLPGVEVFFSPTSIEVGSDPLHRMFEEALLPATALVVVLTPASASSAYLIWETAAVWARGKRVAPIFVDIEPKDVPGPLVHRAQGVHLTDRDILDAAVKTIAREFEIPDIENLTDEEYASLESAALEGDDEPLESAASTTKPKWSISVRQVGNSPVRLGITEDEIKQFLDQERKRLLGPMEEEQRAEHQRELLANDPVVGSAFGSKAFEVMNASKKLAEMAGTAKFTSPETRSQQKFRDEVNDYLSEVRETLEHTVALRLARAGLSNLNLEIQNETTENLDGVQLELFFTIDGFASGDPSEEEFRLPEKPEPWGPKSLAISNSWAHSFPSALFPKVKGADPEVTIEGDQFSVIFPSANLRSKRPERIDPLALVSFSDDEILTAHWKATNKTFGQECSGEVTLFFGPAVGLNEALELVVV